MRETVKPFKCIITISDTVNVSPLSQAALLFQMEQSLTRFQSLHEGITTRRNNTDDNFAH